MNTRLLTQQETLDHWDSIWKMVGLSIAHSNGELNEESFKRKVEDGEMCVAVVFNDVKAVAAVTMDVFNFDTGLKVLNLGGAGGEHAEKWIHQVSDLANEVAKSLGCTQVYVIGRQGWMRKLKHLGYNHVHTIVAKEVI